MVKSAEFWVPVVLGRPRSCHQSEVPFPFDGIIHHRRFLEWPGDTGDILYYHADKQTREELQVQGGKVAWMQQKDSFFSMLTVRETLELAALLELPHFTARQRRRRVQSNMDALGLTKLQHRQIGESSANNGLSGGEQRRLSLALELIASPKLFIGDEPTSGLVSGLVHSNL